jgi:hypothetical protein
MSGLTDRIAEVLREHYPGNPAYRWEWAAGVAAAVAAELQPAEWGDLKQRLERAARTLDSMYRNALHPSDPGMSRLAGKAEGIRLALSYMDEYERMSVWSEVQP